jgi:hypothetical protein
MDLWYDVVIRELAKTDPDGNELLREAESTLAPEPTDEASE